MSKDCSPLNKHTVILIFCTFSRVFETIQGAKIKFSFPYCPDQLRIWSSGVSRVWGTSAFSGLSLTVHPRMGG